MCIKIKEYIYKLKINKCNYSYYGGIMKGRPFKINQKQSIIFLKNKKKSYKQFLKKI